MRSTSASQPPEYDDGHSEYGWPEPPKSERDWKKVLLVLGLGTLSWVATYVGMLELIQSNMGELSLSHKVIIGFSVAMLMTMIIWLLDQMFAHLPAATKLAYVIGYLFLTLISVGFGFGFYWKVLESRSEASRSAESAVTQVKTALFAASTRLDQLQTTLDQLNKISTAKAIEERERGTSCPNSRPGDGPRRKLRDDDAARFAFASQFVRTRAAKAKTDMAALDGDLKLIASADPTTFDPKTGTRNNFLKALGRKLELTATGFNAFRTDPQLRQIRTELADRAAKSVFRTARGRTFSCPDPQLQSALRGVVRAIDQLPELGKPQIATVEGAQAVVEAFRRLTATFYGVLTFKLPPSADELRALQQKAVQSVENAARRQAEIKVGQGGLSKRDYIPLAIAIFVDLCLLLVSIGRPMNRLHGLVPKMREAERGPVYQILSRFDDIHRDGKIREKFEVFRHVVFDFNGDYYVAVPLDAPRNRNPEEVKTLQQESHLLGNLFASFEKEKIFTRVYNPLLTRKTIQKKLWRQGSKFASSQAFRTYRFRDGAWSEIILGAVMGASRRAEFERRQAARDRGPTLDVPAPQAAPLPTPSETPPAAQEASDQTAAHMPQPKPPIDSALREKYGPYAHTMHEHDDDETLEQSDAPPAAGRWPYRKPEPPPAEAEVDLHIAANSNTSPDNRPDLDPGNVIPLPRTRGAPQDTAERLQSLASAIEQIEVPPPAAEADIVEPEGPTAELPEVILQPAPESEPGINVRITERTADFTLPVTDAQLPQHLLSTIAQADTTQLSLDLTDQPLVEHQPSVEETAAIEHDDAHAPPVDITEEMYQADVIGPSTHIYGQDLDDPMLRVAKRFAAGRHDRD